MIQLAYQRSHYAQNLTAKISAHRYFPPLLQVRWSGPPSCLKFCCFQSYCSQCFWSGYSHVSSSYCFRRPSAPVSVASVVLVGVDGMWTRWPRVSRIATAMTNISCRAPRVPYGYDWLWQHCLKSQTKMIQSTNASTQVKHLILPFTTYALNMTVFSSSLNICLFRTTK